MIKAVFLDFDSTLYSHTQNKIPDSAYEAILKAQKNGIKVIVSTGRPLFELNRFDTRNIAFDGYVLNNGEVILNEKKEVLSVHYIDGIAKEKLVEAYQNKSLPISLSNMDDEILNFTNDTVQEAYDAVNSPFPPIGEYQGQDILMAIIFKCSDEDDSKLAELNKYLDFAWWRFNSCDVIVKGISKHVGNIEILKTLNIDIKDCMAVGDSNNDIEMLNGIGLAVAMGNGTEEAKRAADYITDDIDNDGLAKAFKYFELI